ncbi:MAG TPA: FAD-binding oxidoreductase [Mycobacteriales bacterium]|nr:FAD-binding oxidoreductase [Mycobacteriales bacterium]
MPTGPVWEEGGWRALPVLDQDRTADVCVVGLGASGLTAVQELEARGASVVGLDAGTVAGGAAGRNGGFLLAGLARPYHQVVAQLGRERAATLYRRTLEEMDRTPCTTRLGSLRIEDDPALLADCALQAAALRADGFPVVEHDGPEGRGLLFPTDGVLQPLERARALADRCASPLFEHSPALALSGTAVSTPRGTVHCGAVVVAVDGNLDLLLPEVPVRTVRLQMLATAPLGTAFAEDPALRRPVYHRDGYEYWQLLPSGRLALGGFRDMGGAEEETRSSEPSPRVQDALEHFLRGRLGIDAPITHRWAASVGYTDDGLPFLGEVRPGVWAAGGYCGTGNVVGALCGRQAAASALGQPADVWPA